jgi:hypothetical protein
MPLEIRELVIKAEVNGQEGAPSVSDSSAVSDNEDKVTQLVNLCVEKVLKILKEKRER